MTIEDLDELVVIKNKLDWALGEIGAEHPGVNIIVAYDVTFKNENES